MVPPKSSPPGLSIATVHGPPTIYERGQGLGFGYTCKWLAGLVSRVCMAGLDSRVCPGGTKYGAVDSLGGPQFWGDRRQRDRTRPTPPQRWMYCITSASRLARECGTVTTRMRTAHDCIICSSITCAIQYSSTAVSAVYSCIESQEAFLSESYD